MRFQANKRNASFLKAFSQKRAEGDYIYWCVNGVSKINSERYYQASKRFTRTSDFKFFKRHSLLTELRQLSRYPSLVGETIVRRAKHKNRNI